MKSSRNKTITLNSNDNFPLNKKVKINSIVCGDCFSVLKQIKNSSVDLIIADPPYNMDKNFGEVNFHSMVNSEYYEYTKKWIKLCYDKLNDDGTIYVCCDWKCSSTIERVLSKYFIVRNRITWKRDKGRGSSSNWKNNSEDIWFATKSNSYVFNLESVKIKKKVIAPYKENGKPKDWVESNGEKFRYTCPSNLWDDIVVPFWSMPENTEHPTQKPEKLIERLILASSNKNDLVLDPFCGSGTTAICSDKWSRKYIGIELDEKWCRIAMKRLKYKL